MNSKQSPSRCLLFLSLKPAATTSRSIHEKTSQNDTVPTNLNDIIALHQLVHLSLANNQKLYATSEDLYVRDSIQVATRYGIKNCHHISHVLSSKQVSGFLLLYSFDIFYIYYPCKNSVLNLLFEHLSVQISVSFQALFCTDIYVVIWVYGIFRTLGYLV
ncbi:hypothetical protein F511_06568 [Dorcoceras hygrometricum]|uniref:Uncharacterized protein n=1 Tax=Dorcoceras hygrometricum TaxID=472368 RepID=A0A2Z7B7B3_9LAMI|nr:hypothetical protein F511_06568 [Dorcoceras hygrometricum]